MTRIVVHLIPPQNRPLSLSEDVSFLERTFVELWTSLHGQPQGIEVRASERGAKYAFKLGRGESRKRLLRGLIAAASRSHRAFETGRHLEREGVPTPRPLAYLEERMGPVVWRDALVMEYIEAPTLGERVAADRVEASWIRSAAASIHAMHSSGVRHRDLKASNLLAPDPTSDGRGVLILDWDGARLLDRRPSFQVRVRDLARLALSFEILGARERVERSYGELEGWSSDQLRKAESSLAAYATAKSRRNLSRGRPLS